MCRRLRYEERKQRKEDPESSLHHGLTRFQAFRKFLYNYNAIHEVFTSTGALLFLVGSIFFLWNSLEKEGTWLFIIGASSIFIGTIGDAFVTWERKILADEEERAARRQTDLYRSSPLATSRKSSPKKTPFSSKYMGYSHSPTRRQRHYRKKPRLRRLLREYHYVAHGLSIVGHLCFLVGSVLFLYDSTTTGGVWVFVGGSVVMFIGNTGTGLVKYEERQLSEDRERDIGRKRKHRVGSKKRYLRLLIREYIYIHTIIHNMGHISFVVGSVFFLFESTYLAGLWLFIGGSIGYFIGALGNGFVIYEERKMTKERKQYSSRAFIEMSSPRPEEDIERYDGWDSSEEDRL